MGVLPTKRTKNNCSMTEEETVRREGRRSNSFPNRVGWLGYWLLTYSSKAHCDFSCKLSTWATSERPQASRRKCIKKKKTTKKRKKRKKKKESNHQIKKVLVVLWVFFKFLI